MSPSHNIDSLQIVADSVSKISSGYMLQGSKVLITVPSQPGKYLYSGWQSWSLTSWIDINRKMDPLRPRIMHPREIDPQYSKNAFPHGSWYGAVDLSPGKILFLGSLGLNAQVFYDSNNLVGQCTKSC